MKTTLPMTTTTVRRHCDERHSDELLLLAVNLLSEKNENYIYL